MSIYTLGIDIGSTASKCIILKDGKDIVAKSLVDVGAERLDRPVPFPKSLRVPT